MSHSNEGLANEKPVDVLVIGGGPGGYVAAIRAAQLGASVILAEQDKLGGTCLNRGCIPTKALLHSCEYADMAEAAAQAGVKLRYEGIDLAKLMQYKNRVVEQLVGGVNYLVKKNKIQLIHGKGRLVDSQTVEIQTPAGIIRKKARNIIVATGSRAAKIPIPGSDHPAVINSDQALSMEKAPKKIVILGGGAVGVEFAFIYRNLGAEVVVVEMMPQILPQMDGEIAALLETAMQKKQIAIYKSAKIESIKALKGGLAVEVSTGQGVKTLEADQVLMAAGRSPNTEELNLAGVGIQTNRKGIVVDERMATNVKGVYAIGDVAAGGMLLAHSASAEGMVAAENAMGGASKMDYKVVPGCIFSNPEVAGAGLTEKEAREKGYRVKIGKFPFSALGKAVALGKTQGLSKIVTEEETGEILGVHMIGERATDIIAEAALAMRLEATVGELTATIHAHPTFAEGLFESAHAVHNRSIHLP